MKLFAFICLLAVAGLASSAEINRRIFVNDLDRIIDHAEKDISGAASGVKNAVTGVVNKGVNGVNTVVSDVKKGVNTGVTAVKDTVNKGVDDVKYGVNTGVNAVKNTFNKGVNGVNTVVSDVKKGVNTGVTAVKDTVNKGVDDVKYGVNTGVNAVKNTFNKGVKAVKYGVESFVDTWKGIFLGAMISFSTIGIFDSQANYDIYYNAKNEFEPIVNKEVSFRNSVARLLFKCKSDMNQAECVTVCDQNGRQVMGGREWEKYAQAACPLVCQGVRAQFLDLADNHSTDNPNH